MSVCVEDERGLDRVEVAIAAVHACGIASVLAVTAALLLEGASWEVRRAFGPWPIFFGLAVGVFLIKLAFASRRAPRREVTKVALALCALSGLATGVLWPTLVAITRYY